MFSFDFSTVSMLAFLYKALLAYLDNISAILICSDYQNTFVMKNIPNNSYKIKTLSNAGSGQKTLPKS